MRAVGPRFDQPVAPNGYVWWYLDALSDDGQTGITIIAFVGSVFSPYYALARRRGLADPENHCALNVAIYGKGSKLWAMTERGRRHIVRSADTFTIGPSVLAWAGHALTIRINEIAAPVPRRIRGTVRIRPAMCAGAPVWLDSRQRHCWCPVSPSAHVEVDLEEPKLAWQGTGYLDANAGDEPLEDAFAHWTWSRARRGDRTLILYDLTERSGRETALALDVDGAGHAQTVAPPPRTELPSSRWRLARRTRAPLQAALRVIRTLEDTPFYARSSLAIAGPGEPGVAMHESLSLDRFRSPVVQMMLPFRMPRRG